MDQPVLMNADVHKGTKVYDVAYSTGELHPGFQIGNLHDICTQNGFGQIVADITPWFHEFLHDIHQRRHADAKLCRSLVSTVFPDLNREIGEFSGTKIRITVSGEGEQCRCGGIGLGMYSRVVEDI